MRTEFRSVALLAAFALSLPALAQTAPKPDAKEIMSQARSTAASEHKNILLTFGASWCGNCRLFDRFLSDPAIKPIMDKSFVFADVTSGERPDDKRHSNNPGGPELMSNLGGKQAGLPYILMLDPTGKPLTNSLRDGKPTNNIGYPATAAEIDWFMKMLQHGAPDLTPQEVKTIRTWLQAHSPVH